jgi:HEAT repeat protein
MPIECPPGTVAPFLSAAISTELRLRRETDPSRAGLAWLLRLHVCVESGAVREAVLEVLEQVNDVEPLIASLAALSHPDDAAHARWLLGHADWAVRAAAARTLERLGVREDFQRLCAALGDGSWWVRYRAAHALCALPQVDAQDLHALPGRLSDAFAADMLRHALAERGGA